MLTENVEDTFAQTDKLTHDDNSETMNARMPNNLMPSRHNDDDVAQRFTIK